MRNFLKLTKAFLSVDLGQINREGTDENRKI